MGAAELLILSAALSMDAFAVSVCKGLALDRVTPGRAALVGAWFGGFQALMPLLGWLLGVQFQSYIAALDHWIAFGLLTLIGGNMIRESFSDEEKTDGSLGFAAMLPLAVATSIDALAVGVTFAFLQVLVWWAVGTIGAVTFCLSAAGVAVGSLFGARHRGIAERIGGVILILLGIKILLEHLEIIRM